MRIINDIQNLKFPQGLCATIGNFDGAHLGHQGLISTGLKIARERGYAFAVVTFRPHPREVLGHPAGHSPLTTREGRYALLAAAGVENIIEAPFTAALASLSAEEFLRAWLLPLNLKYLLVGHDFSMGRDRGGDMETLRALAAKYNFEVERFGPILHNGAPISSTLLRGKIAAGDVEGAAALLGRFYSISGIVAHGYGRGAGLGFPTANLADCAELLPGNGVYAAFVNVDGQKYRAVVNIGYNPTFNGDKLSVESFLLDANLDLYGRRISIEFARRLRGEIKFSSPEQLSAQIKADTAQAKKILAAIN